MSLPDLWFFLIGVLWVGYLVLEGFDFGVGMLLPVLGRDEPDRRLMLGAIGPVWDGNEVWLLVAGGATFAAFPIWYATLFSGAYFWLVLALLALIVRVISFEWRGKREERRWRGGWQWANTIGSLVAPLLWGVALSSMLAGIPINSKQDFTGDPADFLSAYTLLGGVALVGLCALHGAVFLALKTTGDLRERAGRLAARIAPLAALLAMGFLAWTLVTASDANHASLLPGIVPAVVGAVAALAAVVLTRGEREGAAFAATAVTIASFALTIFISLYPRVLVSSTSFSDSLTVSNASSGHYTLTVMTIVAAVVTPVVIGYQAWSYWVFRERLRREPAEHAA